MEVAFIAYWVNDFSTNFSSNQYLGPIVHAGLQECIISSCTSVWCGMTYMLKTITVHVVHYTFFSIKGPYHHKFQNSFLTVQDLEEQYTIQFRVIIISIFIAAVDLRIELQGLCTWHIYIIIKVLSYRDCVHAHICTIMHVKVCTI